MYKSQGMGRVFAKADAAFFYSVLPCGNAAPRTRGRARKREPCDSLWLVFFCLYGLGPAVGAVVAPHHFTALGAEPVLQAVIGRGRLLLAALLQKVETTPAIQKEMRAALRDNAQ